MIFLNTLCFEQLFFLQFLEEKVVDLSSCPAISKSMLTEKVLNILLKKVQQLKRNISSYSVNSFK